MAATLQAAWGALRFDGAALRRWSSRRLALAWGLGLLAAASLLGGLTAGVAGAQACLHALPTSAATRSTVEALAGWLARSPLPPDAQHELELDLAAVLELRDEHAALPRPLGRAAGCALAGLQTAAQAPYRRLALWLPYTLAVVAVARALGSKAGLAQTLAATSLYALPHLLDVLRPVPGCGPLLGLAISAWGLAIYARAIAAVSGLGWPRTLLAIVLPGLAALTLAVTLLSAVAVSYSLGN